MGATIPFIDSIWHAYRLYDSSQGSMPPGALPEKLIGSNGGYWWLSERSVDTEWLLTLLQRYAPDWQQYDLGVDPLSALGRLLDQGVLTPYQIPHPRKLMALKPYTVFPKNDCTQWRIFPANAVSGKDWSVRSFRDYQEALDFLEALPIQPENLEALGELTFSAPRKPDLPTIARRLTDHITCIPHNMVVLEEPVSAQRASRPRPSEDAGMHHSAPLTPASLNLGPHDEPDQESEPVHPVPSEPPQSLDECEQRLDAARERLKTQGYQSKYTDDELKALAEKGELDDRFVVRVIPSQHAKSEGYLGRPEADGSVKYWSTTFSQLENADTDPKTICAVLGMEYQPGDQYTLAIVDTQAKGAGQATTIVPTYEKLGEFASHEDDDLDPEVVEQVMTPEYSEEYAVHKEAFLQNGGDISKEKKMNDYACEMFSEESDREAFKTRMMIDRKLGANEHFTGDGTTKNLLPNGRKRGVMETLTYDKKPDTLGDLEQSGSAVLIETKPL